MTAFQSWLAGQVKKAGGHSAFLRLTGISSGRLHGWQSYGALPLEPDLVTNLAKATNEDEGRLRDLIWSALRQKQAAPEVSVVPSGFRPEEAGRPGHVAPTGRGAGVRMTRGGVGRRPITRKAKLGLIALALGGMAGMAGAATSEVRPNYTEWQADTTSSVKRRERLRRAA